MNEDRIRSMMVSIAQNAQFIEESAQSGAEYYFRYRSHTFSIMQRASGDFVFYVYPGYRGNLQRLADRLEVGVEPSEVPMLAYESANSGDQKVFADMYLAVAGRHLGLDGIINDILG